MKGMKGDRLKNYSTKIPVMQTIAEIETMLAQHGASDIWKQLETGDVTGLNFAIMTQFGKMPFRLTINSDAIRCILIEQWNKHRTSHMRKQDAYDINYAKKVGWRIIRDWIDAQLAIVEIGERKLEQVFLAEMLDMRSNKTLFQVLTEKKFAGYIMTAEGNQGGNK